MNQNQHPSHHSTPAGFSRTRQDHASELAEDYVEIIDDLISNTGEARLVDVAARMGVTHVTANKSVSRLQRDGLVSKRPYRSIFLTPQGQQLATQTRRRHKIVLKCLRVLGVPQDQARIDAEGIEHHISEITLNAMETFIRAQVK